MAGPQTSQTTFTDKDAPTGNALFDMLTFQNKAKFEQGIGQENAKQANEFNTQMENLRNLHQSAREQEAFQRTVGEKVLTGKAVGAYTGASAVEQAGQGNVFPPLVEQHNDEDTERATGHPLFSPRDIDPRAAEAAHTDFQNFIQGKQRTAEATQLAQAKGEINMIGPEHVQSAQLIANELESAGMKPLAEAFRGLTPGGMTKKDFFDAATKASVELEKGKTRREVSKTFAAARENSAKIMADARRDAASIAARSRVGDQDVKKLQAYQGSLVQEMTKLQNAERMARTSAENTFGDERFNYLREADMHASAVQGIMDAHKQVTDQIGRYNNQPAISDNQAAKFEQERQGVISQLAADGKIPKKKTYRELSPADQAKVKAAHQALHANQP